MAIFQLSNSFSMIQKLILQLDFILVSTVMAVERAIFLAFAISRCFLGCLIFRCSSCKDYDLCDECQRKRVVSKSHISTHNVQTIVPPNNFGIFKFTLSDQKAIIWASKNGHLEVVKLLLNDSRVNPSAQDNYGNNFNDLI